MYRIRQHIFPQIYLIIISGILLIVSFNRCERFEPKAILKIRTDSILVVTANSFTVEGSIVYLGESDIIQYGFCFAKDIDPDIGVGLKNELGVRKTTGSYISELSGLDPNSTYNVKAYATDGSGTTYGTVKTFTTPAQNLPTLSTIPAFDITQDTAKSGGIITDDGGDSIIARGVCWNTTNDPTISNDHTSDGSGTGSFSSSLSGLLCQTTYYVRAYATNSNGTSYGETVSLTTDDCPEGIPIVITAEVTNISSNSALSGGDVTDEGLSSVTAKGVSWGISSSPSIEGDSTTDGSGPGSYTSSITGLSPETTYYVRAYAINSQGTGYGEQMTFTTLDSMSSTIPEEGLVSYYPFNGNANDESGNGHNGEIIGATKTADRFGNTDNAFSFDGNDRIEVPGDASLSFGSESFTISVWARLSSYSEDGVYYLMGYSAGPGNTNKWIFVQGDNSIRFVIGPSPGWINLGTTNFELNVWYNLIIIRNSEGLSAYVNTINIGSASGSYFIPDPDAIFMIGTAEFDRPNRTYKGMIDDIRIYNRALTDEEIKLLYHEGGW